MTVNSDATKTDWVDPDEAPELDDVWFDKADQAFQRGRLARSIGTDQCRGHPGQRLELHAAQDRVVAIGFHQPGNA